MTSFRNAHHHVTFKITVDPSILHDRYSFEILKQIPDNYVLVLSINNVSSYSVDPSLGLLHDRGSLGLYFRITEAIVVNTVIIQSISTGVCSQPIVGLHYQYTIIISTNLAVISG